jgi:alcohol dehydrogenase
LILEKQKITKVLIITDPVLIKNQIVDKVIKQLVNSNIKYTIFEGVKPNPSTEVVNGIVTAYKKNKCNALVSVGGGSAHDAAKGASLVLSNDKAIKKFQGLNATHNVSKMPIIAINTTAGTGSGATNVAVITDEQNHFKMTLVDKNIQPHVLIDDSDLMMDLPARPSM